MYGFQKVANAIFDDLTSRQVRYLQPILPSKATGRVAEIYRQVQRDFQLAPPITLLSLAPDILAGAWSVIRESQIVTGHVPRGVKEAVAAAVSRTNTCPYCVEAHVSFLHATPSTEAVDDTFDGSTQGVQDDKTRDIVSWALATRSPGDALLASPPFSAEESAEIIGTALGYHFINRLVSVFLADSPLPFSAASPRARKIAAKIFGVTVAKATTRKQAVAGDSLQWLPKAPLPDEFSWAKASPEISAAFAGFDSLATAAGEKTLSPPVRECLSQRLEAWRGEDAELSRRWVDDAIADLPPHDQPAARLVLLTAFAAYRVDEKTVKDFRAHQPDDADLVAAAAWASFATVKRISRWLIPADERRP